MPRYHVARVASVVVQAKQIAKCTARRPRITIPPGLDKRTAAPSLLLQFCIASDGSHPPNRLFISHLATVTGVWEHFGHSRSVAGRVYYI